MAEQHGKEGAVKLTTTAILHINEWSADFVQAADEVTAFGEDWKSFIAGIAEWSGSFGGSYDYTDTTGQKVIQDLIITANPSGTTAAARFYVNASNYIGGTIFITGFTISTPVSGPVTFNCTFQGSGVPSYN